MQTKLTVRVDSKWINPAKRYAEQHGTTLSKLISEYLRALAGSELPLVETPILYRLSGILPPEISLEDHQRHLSEKYGV